jgi:hypothetical protein
MEKNIRAITQTPTGRNTKFKNIKTRKTITLEKFIREIQKGNYNGYHIRKMNNKKVPVSNRDKFKGNNLE